MEQTTLRNAYERQEQDRLYSCFIDDRPVSNIEQVEDEDMYGVRFWGFAGTTRYPGTTPVEAW